MKRRTTAVATAGIQTFLLKRGEMSSQEWMDSHQGCFFCKRICLSMFCQTQGKSSFWRASSRGDFINALSSSMDFNAPWQAAQSCRWLSTRSLSLSVASWSKYFSKSLDIEEQEPFICLSPLFTRLC